MTTLHNKHEVLKKVILEYHIPESINLLKFIKQLESQCSLEEKGMVHIQRKYQDSFDWRLYKNHYIFYTEQIDAHKTIKFASIKSLQNVESVEVDILPRQSKDIPSCECQKQLQELLGIRALMTHLNITINRKVFRNIGTQWKTDVHVFLDEYRLQEINAKSQFLERRLLLLPDNAHDASFNNRCASLLKQWKIKPSETSLLLKGLSQLHTKPDNYSAKLNIKLDAEMHSDTAIKKILLFCLDVIEANETGTINDIDTEFLHDFRVSVRRTRSAFNQIKKVFPHSIVTRFEPDFDWLGNITGATRDMHVYLLKLADYQAALPEELQPHLELFRIFLEKHKVLEHKILAEQLKTYRFTSLKNDWREFLSSENSETSSSPEATKPIKETADIHIWKAYCKVIKRGNLISSISPDKDFHKLRISCKKLRYLLEFFKSLYPTNQLRDLIGHLKILQDNLGDYQDLSVQINSFNNFESLMQKENLLTPQTHEAMKHLIKHIQSQIQNQRKLFERSFKQFSDKKHKQLCNSLFKP